MVNIVVLSQLLLLLLPLATAVPIKIISYSATEEKHNHEMEGVPGEAVMGEFSFKVQSNIHPSIHPFIHPSILPSIHPYIHSPIRPFVHSSNHPSLPQSYQAPDTGDAVYKLTYTADMDGFQAMGDHLPVPVS